MPPTATDAPAAAYDGHANPNGGADTRAGAGLRHGQLDGLWTVQRDDVWHARCAAIDARSGDARRQWWPSVPTGLGKHAHASVCQPFVSSDAAHNDAHSYGYHGPHYWSHDDHACPDWRYRCAHDGACCCGLRDGQLDGLWLVQHGHVWFDGCAILYSVRGAPGGQWRVGLSE